MSNKTFFITIFLLVLALLCQSYLLRQCTKAIKISSIAKQSSECGDITENYYPHRLELVSTGILRPGETEEDTIAVLSER